MIFCGFPKILISQQVAQKHSRSIAWVIAYETGKPISGLDAVRAESGVVVFHAGTKKEREKIVTSGGRVLGVTAIGYGHDLEGTIGTAYSAVKTISFDGAYYRSDIGRKGLKH